MGFFLCEIFITEVYISDTIFEAYNKSTNNHYAGIKFENPSIMIIKNNTFKQLDCSRKYINLYSFSGGAISVISDGSDKNSNILIENNTLNHVIVFMGVA